MLDKILLAVDGSDGASAAVAAVARLARRSGVNVLCVHIAEGGRLIRSVQGPDSLTLQWETSAAGQSIVDDATEVLRSAGVSARGQVYGQFDTVARELLDVAHAEGSGLIAMGTSGRGRVIGLLGSVAHRVVHLADTPLLVTPARAGAADRPITRVLLGADGSAGSRRALDPAAAVALLTGAEIVVAHVCEPHAGPWRRLAPGSITVEHDAPQTAVDLVDDIVAALQARGVSAIGTVRASGGNVADGILETARIHDADLITVGSRGRGAIPAGILGSTAYRLLHTATMPVLVSR